MNGQAKVWHVAFWGALVCSNAVHDVTSAAIWLTYAAIIAVIGYRGEKRMLG